MHIGLIIALICAVVALLYGAASSKWVLTQPTGNDRMREIAAAIQQGANAYLYREYIAIGAVGIVVFLVLGFVPMLGWYTAWAFVIGATFSALAGYIGMYISVRANVRTTQAARGSLKEALNIAFRASTITGLLVVGLGLLGVAGYFAIMLKINPEGMSLANTIHPLIGLAFGSSLISIFARLGGGIF